jgi:plasmid stability protein
VITSAEFACYFACVTNVQVRDVPDAVVAALKMRAAEAGQSLQRFLLDLLEAEAGVARNTALLDEAAADTGLGPAEPGEAAELVRAGRAVRTAELAESQR